MNFEEFSTISFPADEDVVYVLCFKRKGEPEEIPFYVGESGRGTRRLSDYITAQFAATTDFKVGVVVKELQAAGAEVLVKYKRSNERKLDEKNLIRDAEKKYALLNNETGFNYKAADRTEQAERFKAIANALLAGIHPLRAISDA